ncbi:leukocyte elastase inhibitor-like isoform X3 [Boleophthalmus pectinirostris]|uniref:leukocyte elastase inhibitor-like isoform X3 n=1 Tax=Boleophthalmus pectinirostris TaxID=150288 RepID=UPI0024304B5B|nr:leukocyte elastase inhibitor-like isoform X3 [Boleophthalmus pectinirostris]
MGQAKSCEGAGKTTPGQRTAVSDMSGSDSLSKANISFTLDLFRSLGKQNKSSNVSFSPLSVSAALSMVLLGAKGRTANQMRECLKTKDCKDVHSSFAALLKELNKKDSSYTVSIANRLYGEQSCKFKKNFLEGTREFYNAELETVDFLKKAEEARVQMNRWVEEQTQGKIKDLLGKDAVDSAAKLVLVNAIYLKADWGKQFEKESTRDAKFRLNKRQTQTVKMMHQSEKFKLRQVNEISCQVIELFYKKELSMLIFLPNDIEDSTTGLEKLEQQLTYESFVEWTRRDKMTLYEVDLRLPRFRIEQNYELNEVLKTMGMEDAFDHRKCDFSGISPAKDLMLSQAVHRAVVDVNEAGTEAAAATMVLVGLGSSNCPRATFNADHPFLFFIRHNPTGAILFAGRFCSEQ